MEHQLTQDICLRSRLRWVRESVTDWHAYLALCGRAFAICYLLAGGTSAADEIARVGLLTWGECDLPSYLSGKGEFGPFIRGLRELGYEHGDTVVVECRGGGKGYDGLARAAAELAELQVDVIVGMSQPAAHAAQVATAKIPIVTIFSGDPVSAGLAQSLARPGGNITGISYYATELTAKRLELLQEMLPGLTTVDVLANPDLSYLPFEADTKNAASKLGLALRVRHVRRSDDLPQAFAEMASEKSEAVFVLPDLMLGHEAGQIATLALQHRFAAMAWGTWFVELGCLMAYSSHYEEMDHRLAFYVDRILEGAKPGDLPIEQPTTFAFSINLKTADALGLTIPQSLLLRADQIIE